MGVKGHTWNYCAEGVRSQGPRLTKSPISLRTDQKPFTALIANWHEITLDRAICSFIIIMHTGAVI